MAPQYRIPVESTGETCNLRFAGLEFAPPLTAEERAEADTQLQMALASGDLSQLPPPRDSSVAVWQDRVGRHFVLLAAEDGQQVAVRFRIGPLRDPSRDDLTRGGFVPAKLLQQAASSPGADLGERAAASLLAGNRQGGSAGGRAAVGAGPDDDGPGAAGPDGRQSRKGQLLQLLQSGIQGLAQNTAGQILGSLVKSGSSVTGLAGDVLSGDLLASSGASLASMGLGGLLSAGTGALFDKLWQVDDSASAAEQLANQYAQELAGIVQSELQAQAMEVVFGGGGASLGPKDWKETFFGIDAPAGLPIVRLGDATDHGGAITTGAATVLAAGQPVARLTDQQVCPKVEPGPTPHVGGAIDQGVANVLVEGQLVAQDRFVSVCQGCGIAAHVVQGQTTVQVGGVATPPPEMPSPPAAAIDPAATAAVSAASSSQGGPPGPEEATVAPSLQESEAGEDAVEGSPSDAMLSAEAEVDTTDAAAAEPDRSDILSEGGDVGAGQAGDGPSGHDASGHELDGRELGSAEGGRVHPEGESYLEDVVKDAATETLEYGAEQLGKAELRILEAEREALETTIKLRWAQIHEIEKDIARGGGSPERLASLEQLRRKLLNQQFQDVPDEALKFGYLKNRGDFFRGVGTAVSGLFALDELVQADASRQQFIQQYGQQASWERDWGILAKTVTSGAMSVTSKFGLTLNIGLPLMAQQAGEAFGAASFGTAKWLTDRFKDAVYGPKVPRR